MGSPLLSLNEPNKPMKKASWYAIVGVIALLVAAAIMWLISKPRVDAAHSVTLTWNAAQPRSGVVLAGYNVYRRTAEGGPFVKIAERVAGPPYEDRLVSSGRKYIYVITSIDRTGRESRFSAEVTAEIP
jgi:fibronectin type 3 domain-containing protein